MTDIMTTTDIDTPTRKLAGAIRAAGLFTLYQEKSYSSPKVNAQLNLDGRTHYAEDGTLGYFHARIVQCREERDGLILGLIESCALDANNTRRGFRPVFFDLSGTVLDRPDLADAVSTKRAAQRQYFDMLCKLDGVAVTRAMLEREHKRTTRKAADLNTLLLGAF